jgi:hypothetical protein
MHRRPPSVPTKRPGNNPLTRTRDLSIDHAEMTPGQAYNAPDGVVNSAYNRASF